MSIAVSVAILVDNPNLLEELPASSHHQLKRGIGSVHISLTLLQGIHMGVDEVQSGLKRLYICSVEWCSSW